MNTNELLIEVQKLDLSKKIHLVEKIWDDIAEQNSTLPISEWQKQELSKRYKKYQNGELELFEGNEVHEKLRSRK